MPRQPDQSPYESNEAYELRKYNENRRDEEDAKNAAECCDNCLPEGACSSKRSALITLGILGAIGGVYVLISYLTSLGDKKDKNHVFSNSTTSEISNYTFSSTTNLDEQAEIFNSKVSTALNIISSAARKIFTGNSTTQDLGR